MILRKKARQGLALNLFGSQIAEQIREGQIGMQNPSAADDGNALRAGNEGSAQQISIGFPRCRTIDGQGSAHSLNGRVPGRQIQAAGGLD
jgi:hypothetical protein